MLELYVDGASAGNPGKSGIGIFIKGEGHHVKLAEKIESTDNHTAEFIALLRGVEEAAKRTTGIVSARSDSKIVVNAIENRYVRKEEFQRYLQAILEIVDTFDYFFIKWIPDSENRAADALARQAIQQS